MAKDLASPCIEVLQAFDALLQQVQSVSAALLAEPELVAWMHSDNQQGLDGLAARQLAVQTLQQVEYLPEQAPREILVRPGLIGASPATVAAIDTLNQQKDQFKASMQALKAAKIPNPHKLLQAEFEQRLNGRPEPQQQHLRRMGLARLHLKQCYRTLPLLPQAPTKVSWTWAHTRSIKRITVAEAEALLLARGNDHGILRQLRLLATLPSGEHLAIVQELAPHMRANLVYRTAKSAEHRAMVKGPVPLIFPATAATPLPELKPPSSKRYKDAARQRRSDIKLEDTPFLPAIRAHRYRTLETG